MYHTDALHGQTPACINRGGIRNEMHAEACGLPTEVPYDVAYHPMGFGRQPVVEALGVRPTFAFNAPVLRIVPNKLRSRLCVACGCAHFGKPSSS